MAWIADTFASTKSPSTRMKNLHVVTGKPMGSGGLEGRDRATGFGVVVNIQEWAKLHEIDLKNKRFIVQGFGNVGYWASHFLHQLGAKLIAVQDASGTYFKEGGIDPEMLNDYTVENEGKISGFNEATLIPNEEFFGLDCDIIIPAALGNQITIKNADQIRAKLIAEGANGPIDSEAEDYLLNNGFKIIPDILCNAGGVIGSYYEWLQNKRSENWKIEYVLEMIEDKISIAFRKTVDAANFHDTDWRTGAYMVAMKRIEQTYKERGVFP